MQSFQYVMKSWLLDVESSRQVRHHTLTLHRTDLDEIYLRIAGTYVHGYCFL